MHLDLLLGSLDVTLGVHTFIALLYINTFVIIKTQLGLLEPLLSQQTLG
jgi:hypothetical protein